MTEIPSILHGAAFFPADTAKRPLPGWKWTENFSRDPAQVAAWRAEGHNVAINVGASNFIVVDIDAKGDRDGAWQLWCDQCAEWEIPVVEPAWQTRSGGWHVLFRAPEGMELHQPDLVKGRINVRAGNGYVLCPPSDGYTPLPGAAVHRAPPQLIDHCKRVPADTNAETHETFDLADITERCRLLVSERRFDAEQDWISSIWAIKRAFGESGWPLAVMISDIDEKNRLSDVWNREGKQHGKPMTCATLITWSNECGYRPSAAIMFKSVVEQLARDAGATLTSGSASANGPLIKSSAEFLRGFVPPDYILDGVLQRGFCYSLTAKTGTGKTAIAMCFSAHVATGRHLNNLPVQPGSVVYLAGENPTDIQMRWLGVTQQMRIDPETVPVYFLPGVISISQNAATITKEVADRNLQPALVVVDTAAAYFEGDNENDNVQQGNNARLLRSLTGLPGTPCVLILCHPTKRAGDDDLLPRGGGAFLNEVDGNIALKSNGELIGAEVQGKFRGPAFTPLLFKLDVVRDHPLLKDTKGRNIPTVVARAISEAEMAASAAGQEQDENRLLRTIERHPRASLRELAIAVGSTKSKVHRNITRLIDSKLIKREGRKLLLTQTGQRELNELDSTVSPPLQPQFSGIPFPTVPAAQK